MNAEKNSKRENASSQTDRLVRFMHKELAGTDPLPLQSSLEKLHAADIADTLARLTDEEREKLFHLLDEKTAAEVLDDLDSATQAEIIEDLGLAELADIVGAMPLDEAADILGELEEDELLSVLEKLESDDSQEVKQLLTYGEETAGGIMTPEFFAVSPHETAAQVTDQLRQEALQDEIFYVYVIDTGNHLLGTVPLRRLVTAPKNQPVQELMRSDVVTVPADMDQEDAARLAVKYDLLALPVVDSEGRVLGRITVDDLMEVLEEEASEDILTLAGTGEEALENRSVLSLAKVRIPWLLLCLAGSVLSAMVLERFNATLSQAMALAFFIPAIMAMGGNSGIQTSTIVVRGLGTGAIRPKQLPGILVREMRVVAVIGILCGLLVSVAAQLLTGTWIFGVIVGLSLASAMAVAVAGGVLWPMLCNSLGIDPAIAAGPFITTTNDITGLLIYFLIASALLRVFG